MEIIVPRLGWSMEEATFAAWLKQEGSVVRVGDPLFTLESDKATQDVEALDGGVLRLNPDGPLPGATVRVGQCIGFLDTGGGSEVVVSAAVRPTAAGSQPARCSPTVAQGVQREASVPPRAPEAVPELAAGTRVRISPRALRTAAELGVDWKSLKGSGRAGRIREADVRIASAAAQSGGLSTTRRLVAERMTASLRQTAPVTLHATADATAWVQYRARLKSAGATPVPSFTDLLIHQVAVALRQHSYVNARWEGEALVSCANINIGLAVDTEEGLLVPVIRDADGLTLEQITARAAVLVERARARRLSPDEMNGGTFTVTSLGGFGVDAFTPIINYPECAILGLGRIRREPVVVGEQIVPRDRVTLSLTFDHRAFDGAPAARFLHSICQRMEQD